jgi:hypothetical protein
MSLHRILPLNSRVITGSRVLKKRPMPMLDVSPLTSDGISLTMDGNNLAIELDRKTAFELAITILEELPLMFFVEHVVEDRTAGSRLKDLAGTVQG